MHTELAVVSEASIQRAAELLAGGDVVAFPTETVYGLGARADDPRAVKRIYLAKGRAADKPLIVHVRDIAAARAATADWPEAAERLARAFWPGPVTLVLPKAAWVPDAVTAKGATVAVRAPAHPASIALLDACDFAIAAPSANPSGLPPPTSAAEVLAGLGGRIPFILDGGPSNVKVPSTIVDLSGDGWRILREGAVSEAEVRRAIEQR